MKNLEKKILKSSIILGMTILSSTNFYGQTPPYPFNQNTNGVTSIDDGSNTAGTIINDGNEGYNCFLRFHSEPGTRALNPNNVAYMLNNWEGNFSISKSTSKTTDPWFKYNKGEDYFKIAVDGTTYIGADLSVARKIKANSLRIENEVSIGGDGVFNIDAPGVQGGRLTVLGKGSGSASGNVGIGNANPLAKLDVTGTVNATGLITATAGIQIGDGNLAINTIGDKIQFATNTNNTDDLFIARVNRASNISNILVNIGNEIGATSADTFTVGNGTNSTIVGSLNKNPFFTVNSAGYVGIGTVGDINYELSVNGGIEATNYTVTTAMTADYVFEDSYKLKTLAETEAYIKENKHLPAFKSAKHYEANGYTMIDMDVALEQTVEELTLHAIAQEKKIVAQETEMAQLKTEMAAIKALLLKK
jgi:hypothetical protein